MSGPIVRKYGFPNFEQIFGKREMEHGVDEDEAAEPSSETAAPDEVVPPAEDAGKAASASKKKKPRGK